jgi:tetratricopeptide (TPR) repeat protein
MEEKEKQTTTIKMEVDLTTNKVIGVLPTNKDTLSNEQLDIASGIISRIQNLFNSDGSDWINDYLNLIEQKGFNKAYDLLINKYTFLKQPVSSSFFDNLLKLDYRKLSRKKQYTYLNYIIALGYRGNFYKQIELLLDIIINEFQEFTNKKMQGRIYLTKSDIYIKTGNILSANRLLNIIINDSEYPAVLKAYAYRQLSWLSPFEKDKLTYIEHAHDLFLISGHKREAIQELVGVYDILISKSPDDALSKIDLAIQILESESYIDKEISASLHTKKANVLYIQRNYNESFSEIEKAIELQKDLIGNESEKYGVFKFAEVLMGVLGNKEKQNEFSKIANNFKNKLLSDDYMDIQFSLEEASNTNQVISDELKEIILERGEPEHKFGFFLFYALNTNTPFEEKLHLLDMALQIQESSLRNDADKSLVYNAIAEVYKEHGDIFKAIEWYEKTFSVAPYNMNALENYMYLLQTNSSWEQLESLCKRYINIVGYFPNLYYIYGKSLFNQSKYSEAFTVFGRCRKDIRFSIDKEILECSEHINKSDFVDESILLEKKRISIDEFINAAKEVTDSISQRSRMHLWKHDKKIKSYKWISRPEEEIKNLFIQGIVQKFNQTDFEIIEEVKTGAGRIDLYVIIGNDLKIIIELKICGCGYSSNYAISGEKQLDYYLESKGLSFGILIVFDGRIRDFSKGFSQFLSIDNKAIHTIVVDMRSKF